MYLTRTAGIETRCLSSRFRIPQMYLTRTAGIETSVTEIVQTRLIKCILPALRELKQGVKRIQHFGYFQCILPALRELKPCESPFWRRW